MEGKKRTLGRGFGPTFARAILHPDGDRPSTFTITTTTTTDGTSARVVRRC